MKNFIQLLLYQTRDQERASEKLTFLVFVRKSITFLKKPRRSCRRLWKRLGVYAAYIKLSKELNLVDIYRSNDQQDLGKEWYDLLNLYHQIRQRRISRVVEFGSGQSTAIICAALEKNRLEFHIEPKFISVERDPRWYEISEKYVPDDYDWAKVVFFDNQGIDMLPNDSGLHPVLPEDFGKPDFLYFDDWFNSAHQCPVVDPELISELVEDGCVIVVDGRWQLTQLLTERLSPKVIVIRNFLHHLTIVQLKKDGKFVGPWSTGTFSDGSLF